MANKLKQIESCIKAYPDFPKKGILFRDLTPIYRDHQLRDGMLELICQEASKYQFDRILGVESRGFILGAYVSQKLKLPFELIRKRGKLPGDLYTVEYELEYGKDTLEIQKDALPKGSKCFVIDDLIATGGSLEAAKKLVEMSGSEVTVMGVVIELGALNGKKKLGDTPYFTLFRY